MEIRDFGVEMWMNAYENNCTYNLAETCVESLTLEQLLDMDGHKNEVIDTLLKMQLTYGDIEGSHRLKEGIKSLYQTIKSDNQIAISHGAIGGNELALSTIVNKEDHVISVLPTYQQHYSIPASIGAEVDILPLEMSEGFLPNLDRLKGLIKANTKLICINNPNNPTGALMDESYLKKIVDIAKAKDIYILCDEVYRGLNHEGDYFTPSIVDLYDKGIATSSMSKTFSLAGLRLGWIVGPETFIEKVNRRRDYNLISCSKIVELLGAIALENKDVILKRNHDIIDTNKVILHQWVEQEEKLSYIEPQAGTTAFIKYDFDMPSEEFCVELLDEKGVMLVPGKALDVEGYFRIGYAYSPKIFKEGLEKISEFLKTL